MSEINFIFQHLISDTKFTSKYVILLHFSFNMQIPPNLPMYIKTLSAGFITLLCGKERRICGVVCRQNTHNIQPIL